MREFVSAVAGDVTGLASNLPWQLYRAVYVGSPKWLQQCTAWCQAYMHSTPCIQHSARKLTYSMVSSSAIQPATAQYSTPVVGTDNTQLQCNGATVNVEQDCASLAGVTQCVFTSGRLVYLYVVVVLQCSTECATAVCPT